MLKQNLYNLGSTKMARRLVNPSKRIGDFGLQIAYLDIKRVKNTSFHYIILFGSQFILPYLY